jgi:NAD+ diphosphatase
VPPRINFYAGLGLDRLGERRRDRDWLEERFAQARLVPIWRSRNLVIQGDTPAAVLMEAASLAALDAPRIFLGEENGVPYFAVDLSAFEEADIPNVIQSPGAFVDLRAVGALMDRQHGALLAYARGLMHWHARHRFCGVCGAPTIIESAGHVRHCTNPDCGADHFPRTDPAVIMLVTDGDRCLLARQQQWLPGMHSTLAGFVEPGESLEEAVAREVYEEAGIQVRDVTYHSSQPWPFPASIMLGFYATAVTTDLRFDNSELETGGWYTRDWLRQQHDPEKFRPPRIDSIARRLIEDWLADE